MDITPAQFYSAIGAIIAALIGGFLSLLTLITSKDQKISELRNEWISDFRKELAELIAEVRYAIFWVDQYLADPANTGKNPYLDETYKTAYLCFAKAFNSIKLRIDPDERSKKRRKLNAALSAKLTEISKGWKTLNSESAETLTRELRECAEPLLKFEWKSIERGSFGHVVLKWAAVIILVLGLSGVAIVGVKFAHINPGPSEQKIQPTNPASPSPSATNPQERKEGVSLGLH